jgi:hypothetical protein
VCHKEKQEVSLYNIENGTEDAGKYYKYKNVAKKEIKGAYEELWE